MTIKEHDTLIAEGTLIDPKRVGRDSREDRRKRIEAAFEAAAKIKEQELKNLKKQGLSGEALKEKLGSISELANMLYHTRPQELDRLADAKEQKMQELARLAAKSKKAPSASERTSEKIDEGFRNLLQRKEQDLEKSRRSEGSPSRQDRENETFKQKSERRDDSLPKRESSSKGQIKEHSNNRSFSETVKESMKISNSRDEFSKAVYRLHFREGLTQQEIADRLGVSVHTIYRRFEKEGWTPNLSTKKIDLNPDEVQRLYEGEGLSQKEIAKKLGVSESTIYRHFKKHGIEPHRIATRDEVDVKEVHRLHFDEKLTRNEVSEKLGVSEQTISRIFRDQGWVVNRVLRSSVDIDEVRRLYFDERLTQKEVAKKIGVSTQTISRIFKDQQWEARRTLVDIDELHRLHFIENLNQREIADKLNIPEETIRHHFRKHNWEVKLEKVSVDEIYQLYFVENFTQQEIAKKLDVCVGTIRRHFREQNWKIKNQRKGFTKHRDVSIDEVHRLYFDEKLNQSEVAKILGVPYHIISRIFKEKNWKHRNNLVYVTEKEREAARLENRKKITQRIDEMREQLFGKECRICGEERKIIHKKDGEEHEPSDLWRLSILKSVNPDEWAALCIPCHLGVHWMMNNYDTNWSQLETQSTDVRNSPQNIREPLELPTDQTPSTPEYLKLKSEFQGNRRELRMALFGEKCHFCGIHYEEKRIAIHRKDGRPHAERLTVYEKYFRTLNPDEWVSLCQNHHRFVHWTMDTLGLQWDDLKNFKIKENGAEGEIYSNSEKSRIV